MMTSFRSSVHPRARLLQAVVLGALWCQLAVAQEVTAGITGRVTDQSDAPIANATVTARDTERGTTYTAATNQEGVYILSRLPISTYQVRVEVQGFQTAVHPQIRLELNQTPRLDFGMRVGQVTETVEVTADAPLLQTETTQLGTVINAVTNVNLPLASRNYVQLTLLAPGSVNPNPSTMTSGNVSVTSGRPYVNGNREQANNFLLDGMDNNQVSDNLVGYTPSPDAIQEFNMITNNAPAEFGNFQGGIINVSIKSGTNQFHGSLFEFFRNDKLNANSWSNNWSGAPREKLRWNMFGGTIGGPIVKNRVFFFGDYQGQRFNRPASTGTITVFTAEQRRGDFSRLLTERGVQLYNPFELDANGNRVPFLNNQIPGNLINPVARALFSSSLYPLPVNNQLQNNYFNTSRSWVHTDQGDIKIDANLTDNDRLFGRYSRSRQDNPSTNSFPLLFGSFFEAPTHNGVLNWTRSITPAIVNEFRTGVNYIRLHNGGTDNGLGNIAEDLGIQNGNDLGPGLFGINFGANLVNNIGNSNIGTQQMFANTVIQVGDTAVISRGRHIMHAGFQFWRYRINTFYAGNSGRTGSALFSGKFTAGPSAGAVAGGGAGAGEADFLLGLPEVLNRGVSTGTWGQRANSFAGYFQDTFRVTNTLNLNYGLRYENRRPWREVNDRASNFSPFTGELQLAGTDTIYEDDRALYNPYDWGLNFQPRLGFAWTPGGRGFVVRGAYTISSYLEGTGTNLRLTLNPPFNSEFETRYSPLTLPESTISEGLTVLQSPEDPFAGATIRLWDPNIRPAAVQQWNLTLQQQIGQNTTLQVGYVGQKGTHLMVPMPYFQRQLLADGTTAPSPYLSGNPALAGISQISGTESNGTQRYDALQATMLKRYSDGLQFQVAYTYSKCMTNSSGYYGSWGGQAVPTSPYWQNLYDMAAEWGPCYYDVTHVLTSYAVYELPVGRGRRFGKDMPAVADAIVGGWNLSGILTLRGGFPLTISAGDATGTNSRGSRANCNAPAEVFGRRSSPSGGYQWFDPNSYGPPNPGEFGTCGVGTVRGPGLSTLDLSVMKQFAFTETKRLEFRGEFLNAANTPILAAPNTGLGSGLGLLQGSQGPRNVQLALKFYF